MARRFQLQDQVVNISSSFLEAGMAAENVGFRELKSWELMSRIGARCRQAAYGPYAECPILSALDAKADVMKSKAAGWLSTQKQSSLMRYDLSLLKPALQ